MGYFSNQQVEEQNPQPSGIEWRQKIHRALGGQLGAVCFTLEEAVARIEGLRGPK